MSDEIPIGSPPAPPGRHAAPLGWYPDPVDPQRERYWDGWQWSSDVRAAARPHQPQQAAPQVMGPHGSTQPGHGQPPQAWNPAQAPVPMTADGVPLAGWWHRAGAILLDGIMLAILQSIAILPLLGHTIDAISAYFDEVMAATRSGAPLPAELTPTDLMDTSTQFLISAVSLVIALAWYTLFVRFKGATPGKLITGLRVVPVDQGRHTGGLGWGPSISRALVWVLPTINVLLMVLRVVDVVMAASSPKKQALHDAIAKTQVVRSR